jgi:hypothetical protein
MKLVLVGVLIAASAGLSVAQPAQSTCRDFGRTMEEISPQLPLPPGSQAAVVSGARFGLIARILKETGVGVAADCIEVRSSGFRAQGNVTLSVGDIVITADDAVVANGEVQLTGNSRLRVPAK